MSTTVHAGVDHLEAGLAMLTGAPTDDGTVAMVVARPAVDERVVLDVGEFTTADGLVGDRWRAPDSGSLDAQLTLISRRWLDVLTFGDRDRWPLAGDQVVVDLDLSQDNLQTGDRLRLGTAVVEVTAKPHTGCKKFVERFGVEAQRLGASVHGRRLRLRGIYVKVVEPGTASPGDAVTKVTT